MLIYCNGLHARLDLTRGLTGSLTQRVPLGVSVSLWSICPVTACQSFSVSLPINSWGLHLDTSIPSEIALTGGPAPESSVWFMAQQKHWQDLSSHVRWCQPTPVKAAGFTAPFCFFLRRKGTNKHTYMPTRMCTCKYIQQICLGQIKCSWLKVEGRGRIWNHTMRSGFWNCPCHLGSFRSEDVT